MAHSKRSLPRDIVVMARETPTPTLRAGLRAAGMFIPPSLARLSWGPPVIRERLEVVDVDHDDVDAPPPAPSRQRPPASGSSQTPANPTRSAYDHEGPSSAAGSEGYSTMPSDVGSYGSPDSGYDSSYGGPSSGGYSEPDYGGPSSGGGYGGPSSGGGGGYDAPEPETRQLNVGQIDAIAAAIGESTTQASHRAERLDLSDWGFLMRVVMLAGPDDPEPRRALDQLVPTIGEWLRNEVDQPARLEYDRRFRHEVQKQLAKFLTDQLGRFPVIKAELQYIE